MKKDPATYQKVRQQYDQWVAAEAARPPRARLRRVDSFDPTPSQIDPEMSRQIAAGIGFGIGAVLLILALIAFRTSAYWGSFGRDGAQVGFFVAGFFLLIAGFGGIAATWNHNFRVLARRPDHG